MNRSAPSAVLLISGAMVMLLALHLSAAERKVLSSNRPSVLKKLQPTGRPPATQRLELILGLPLRQPEVLTNLISQLYDPLSTNFHQYLTPDQFTDRFAPPSADYQALTQFMVSNRFRITATDPGRTLLHVNGSVSDVERLFGVHMLLYQHPLESRVFYAPDTDPSLELPIPLLEVVGLDNYQIPRPNSKQEVLHGEPRPLVGSGPGNSYLGQDFRRAYAPGTTLTGKGQTVGLLQLDGYYPADIAAYTALAGISNVPLVNVLIDGATGSPTTNVNAVSEVSLDIEMVISMAPGISNLVVYEAPANSTGPLDILKRMASDNIARQLSSSWAIGDSASADQVYQQFAAQGQSFFQSSGDRGAYYAGLTDREDSSYKTIVGGTILTTGDGAAWQSETAWNDADGTNATGGGISGAYSIPGYQQPVSMALNLGSATQRNSPDVAMVAQGVWVIFNNGSSGSFEGTSVATPLWAGYTALINEQAAKKGRPGVGFINPTVYALGRGLGSSSYFHDIATGNNTNSVVTNSFPAVVGYDLCTGWGSPTGTNFIDAVEGLAGAIWVAFGGSDPGDGSYGRPYNTLARARDAVAPGGTVAIKGPGSTPEAVVITKALTLRGAGGIVTIGH